MTDISEEIQAFARDIGRVCKKYGVISFRGYVQPSFRDPHPEEITLDFQAGRHGINANEIVLTSTRQVRVDTRVDGVAHD